MYNKYIASSDDYLVTRFMEDGLVDENYKGIRLEVMSLAEIENYIPDDNEVCISINSFGQDYRPNLEKFTDTLLLSFDDSFDRPDGTPAALNTYLYYITKNDAYKVIQFVDKHLDKKAIVIHCHAGVSRSRSMAAALAKCYNLPYKYTKLNSRVYHTMMNAYIQNEVAAKK